MEVSESPQVAVEDAAVVVVAAGAEEEDAVVAVEVHEAEQKLLSSHTDMVVSTLPRVKKMYLPPKTWYQEIPSMARRKLR